MADSQIRSFYSGKNFFITGGTGFVGLCLIERILRSLPEAGKIYLLMRPKRGKGVEERMQEIKKKPLFETLLQTNTAVFKKIIPVIGDVGELNLGLSLSDRQLIDNVNIIVHSAAALDFDLNLKMSMEVNTVGTKRVLDLACQLKELKAFFHVSSAYVNNFLHEYKEILYDVPENVDQIINQVYTLTEEELSPIEPTLLKIHPVFYTITKNLAEHEVAKYADKFPCTIVRPSLITSTWKEPVAGWISSNAGMIPFITGAWLGLVRRMILQEDNIVDIIPVDVFVNQVLVAGFQASKSKGLSIYHCTSSTEKPYRWGIMAESFKRIRQQYPLENALWYPHLKITNSLLLFRISCVFIHIIPAILLDLFQRITGGKPVLPKLRKSWNILKKVEMFCLNEWKFCNGNIVQLAKEMNETDKKIFYISLSDIDWKIYTTNMLLGIRKYLLREDDSNLEAAKFKMSVLLMMHIIWHILLFSFLWSAVATLTGLTMPQCVWCVPVLYILYSLL